MFAVEAMVIRESILGVLCTLIPFILVYHWFYNRMMVIVS